LAAGCRQLEKPDSGNILAKGLDKGDIIVIAESPIESASRYYFFVFEGRDSISVSV